MKSNIRQVLFSAAACILLAPAVASASPLFETLGNQQGTSGLNSRFERDTGSAAAYYNPAMLSAAPDSIDIGFTIFQQSMNFTYFARPDRVDVPDEAFGGGIPGFDLTSVPTSILEGEREFSQVSARPRGNYNGTGDLINMATIGLTINIIPKYLVAGLSAYIPLGTYTQVESWFSDERDQFFTNSLHATLYEDRMRAPTLSLGFASNPIEQLRIGLAFTLALKATAQASAYAPQATDFQETIQLGMDVGVIAKIAPHFSVVYEPVDELSLSFTAHSPSKFEIDTAFSAFFAIGPTGNEDSATRTTVHDYMPWIFGLGADYRIPLKGEKRFDISAGAQIALWSKYIDRQGRTPSGIYAWKNTVAPSLGLSFEDESYSIGLSAIYQPTPVPEQTGRTSYADNNRLGGTLTGTYRTELSGLPLELGLQVGSHRLLEREHNKVEPDPSRHSPARLAELVRDEIPDDLETSDGGNFPGLQTNNPGYPGYRHDGYLWNASLFLKIQY